MRNEAAEKLVTAISLIIEEVVERKIDEHIYLLRIQSAAKNINDAPEVEALVDAVKVAEMLGKNVSTDKCRRAAVQAVYHLARRSHLPSVRLSPRRVMFEPTAVRQFIAQGGSGGYGKDWRLT